MNLNTFNPMNELNELWEKYNRLFDKSPAGIAAASAAPTLFSAEAMATWAPAVDIVEIDRAYLFKVEIPAVDQENVQVYVDNSVLKIEGERQSLKESNNMKFHRVERFHGRFARSFELPGDAEENDVIATFKDGLLTIEVKKSSERNKRAIPIQNLNQ